MTGKLYIKKRKIPEWLTLFIVVMPFLFGFLLESLRLPNLIKYTIDVAWFCLLIMMIFKRKFEVHKNLTPFVVLIVLFLLYTLIAHLFNLQNPLYYLWGVRNNFRFYVAFFAFAYFLTEHDSKGLLKFMDFLFWVNVLVSFVQFFILGYRQDYLGGIFGTSKGCNAYSIIFFTIILTRSLLQFMNREENAFLCMAKCLLALIISAMAELKVFFVFFALILIVATFITSFSKRKLLLILGGVVILFIGVSLLEAIFEMEGEFTLEKLWELVTQENYSSQNDIGRLTAIPQLIELLSIEGPQRWFGLGLGNCDTSSFTIFNTPFYQQYNYLHYSWFSSAFLFLETGYIGLAFYALFFIFTFVFSCWKLKKGEGNKLFYQMGIIISMMCVIMAVYNSAMRTEAAYMMYFALALPFIGDKAADEEETEEET